MSDKKLLRILGMGTPAAARATLLVAALSVLVCVAGMALVSYAIEKYLEPGLPLYSHAAAIAVAGFMVFLSVLLLRGAMPDREDSKT